MSTVEQPSYEDLAALVVALTERLVQAEAQIAALRAEVEAFRSKSGKDSTNSSAPPSSDSVGAKARRKAAKSQRVRSKDRKRGGQVGRIGSGLVPTADPDRSEQVDAAVECLGCGADLADGTDAGATWAQVWDTADRAGEGPQRAAEAAVWVLRELTTAAAPFGQAGAVSYGPNVNSIAILLASQGNVPVEAAMRPGSSGGSPVGPGGGCFCDSAGINALIRLRRTSDQYGGGCGGEPQLSASCSTPTSRQPARDR